MAGCPVCNGRRELTCLNPGKRRVLRRCDSNRILVEPNLHAYVTRIEATIDARLDKPIEVGAKSCIQINGKTRVQKEIVPRKEERWCRLVDVVRLQMQGAAELKAQAPLKGRERKPILDVLKEFALDAKRGSSVNQHGDGCPDGLRNRRERHSVS